MLRPEDQFEKLGSIGKEIFGTDRIRILDENRNEVPDGDVGELFYRTPMLFKEYLKDPDKGFEAYQELLTHYPGTKEAVNALYEVGAYYLKKKEYDKAVKSYQQFIYNYSTDTRVENAMLAIAQCYMEKKTWDKALDAYQSYLNRSREKVDVFDVARGYTTQIVDEIIEPKDTRIKLIEALEITRNRSEKLPPRAKMHGTPPT